MSSRTWEQKLLDLFDSLAGIRECLRRIEGRGRKRFARVEMEIYSRRTRYRDNRDKESIFFTMEQFRLEEEREGRKMAWGAHGVANARRKNHDRGGKGEGKSWRRAYFMRLLYTHHQFSLSPLTFHGHYGPAEAFAACAASRARNRCSQLFFYNLPSTFFSFILPRAFLSFNGLTGTTGFENLPAFHRDQGWFPFSGSTMEIRSFNRFCPATRMQK